MAVSPLVPFVRFFYGTLSEYLWEDSDCVVHSILQSEGGEQGDHMIPLPFSVGQHHELEYCILGRHFILFGAREGRWCMPLSKKH